MIRRRAFITDVGIVSPAGVGLASTRLALEGSARHFVSPSVFQVASAHAHPVAQVTAPLVAAPLGGDETLPRTHRLALTALAQLSAEFHERMVAGCHGHKEIEHGDSSSDNHPGV